MIIHLFYQLNFYKFFDQSKLKIKDKMFKMKYLLHDKILEKIQMLLKVNKRFYYF